MTNDYDFLKRSKLFKNEKDIQSVVKISENKYKINDKDNKSYIFALCDMDHHELITNEEFLQDILRNIGLIPLEIYEEGIMPDLNKAYKIFEYRKEKSLKEFLSTSSAENQFEIGKNFGSLLEKFHKSKITENVDWEKKFLTKSNYLFYIHGLSEDIGDRDYILIDYIQDNIHLTKNTPINLLHGKINDRNIRIYDDNKLDFRGLKEIDYGDGVFDFVDINKIAIDYPKFAQGVLDGYFNGKRPSRKFFRLLSLYQAYVILYNKVDKNANKDHNLDDNQINDLMQMYDEFNRLLPDWVKWYGGCCIYCEYNILFLY